MIRQACCEDHCKGMNSSLSVILSKLNGPCCPNPEFSLRIFRHFFPKNSHTDHLLITILPPKISRNLLSPEWFWPRNSRISMLFDVFPVNELHGSSKWLLIQESWRLPTLSSDHLSPSVSVGYFPIKIHLDRPMGLAVVVDWRFQADGTSRSKIQKPKWNFLHSKWMLICPVCLFACWTIGQSARSSGFLNCRSVAMQIAASPILTIIKQLEQHAGTK